MDESLLRRRIERALGLHPQITLAELVDIYPIEKGLAEIITYLAIAAKDTRHQIHELLKEPISLGAARSEGDVSPRLLMVPQILFRRNLHAQ